MLAKKQAAKVATKKIAPSFGHEHYVPLLKSKAGELWALERTTAAQRKMITPLFEIHREGEKTLFQHAAKLMLNIERSWNSLPLFLDTHLFGVAGSAAVTAATTIFQAAANQGLSFVPVTSLNRSNAYQGIVRSYTHRGVMIRLVPDDFYDVQFLESQLDTMLLQIGIPPSHVDILLDYGAVADHAIQIQAIRAHVNSLPYLTHWRTLTVAGGAFPSSLAAQPPHQWHGIPREEWTAWSTAVTTQPSLARFPAYADYGVRDTQPPAQFGSPYANIRYTTGGLYLVRRHDVLFRNGGSDGIYPICSSLRARPEFSGPTFSAGDDCIETTAVQQLSPGNPGSWTQWGMSHHFAVVVGEIQNLLAA